MSAIPGVRVLEVSNGAGYIEHHVQRYAADARRGGSRQLVDYYCSRILRAAQAALTSDCKIQFDVTMAGLLQDTTYGTFDERQFLTAWNEIVGLADNGFRVDDGGSGSRVRAQDRRGPGVRAFDGL